MDLITPAPPPPPVWPCEGCGYNVNGTRDAVCPECGRAFDPSELTPERLAKRRRHPRPWIGPVLIALQFAPIVWEFAFYGWARLLIGRWPTPGIDDPSNIPGYAIFLVGFMYFGIIAIFPVLPIVHLARCINAAQHGQRWKTLVLWLVLGTVAWAMAIPLNKAISPPRLTWWLFD